MTLSTTDNVKSYTGDNSTTEFVFPNLFFSDAHLVVTIDGVLKVLSTDYTVAGAGLAAGGSVTFTTAPASGTAVVIQRIVPLTQETDLENFDGNPADVTEKQFDLLAMSDQQIEEKTERSILAPIGSVLATNTITGTIDATDKLLTISTAGPSVTSFGDLSSSIDVILTGETDGDLLQYDGSNFVNTQTLTADLTLSGACTHSGDNTFSGFNDFTGTVTIDALTLGGNANGGGFFKMTNMADPGFPQDYATKNYVDTEGGGLKLLGSYTASNDTSVDIGDGLDLDAVIDGTYDEYVLRVVDLIPASTSNVYFRTSSDTGSTFDSGGTDYEFSYVTVESNDTSGGAATAFTNPDRSEVLLTNGSIGTVGTFSATIRMATPSNSGVRPLFDVSAVYEQVTTLDVAMLSGGFSRRAAAAIDAVRIFMSTGNISSGKFYLYGVRKT